VGYSDGQARRLVPGNQGTAGSAKFPGASVGIERLVAITGEFLATISCPVNGGIQNVGAPVCVPFQPGVCLMAGRHSSADHEPDIPGSVGLHLFVKRDRFAFAICHRGGLDFMGGLPFGAKTVGNFAQALDPTIYQRQRYVLFCALRFRDQDWVDAGHLSVVGGRRHAKEDRLREAGENGEADDAEDEEENLFWLVGMNTYKNHSIYGSYKQRTCHPLMP
jgi:hypothetical protein